MSIGVNAGLRLRTILPAPARTMDWQTLPGASVHAPSPTTLAEADVAARDILTHLMGEPTKPAPRHPAVRRLLRRLPTLLNDDVRLPALAREAGISEGRLSHLFRAEVGIPLRPYVRWMRLRAAAAALAGGANLTEAAHAAGFADSAHLTRTFRNMFGIVPSTIHHVADWLAEPALTGTDLR